MKGKLKKSDRQTNIGQETDQYAKFKMFKYNLDPLWID